MTDLADTIRAIVREEVARVLAERGADRLITVAAAAELASVRPATIRTWIADGRIPAKRAGRRLRVRAVDVERALAAAAPRARAARPPTPEQLAEQAVREVFSRRAGGRGR